MESLPTYLCLFIFLSSVCYSVWCVSHSRACLGLLRWCSGKELPTNAGDVEDVGFIPGQEDSPEQEMTTHSSILAGKNPMARGALWATVDGVAKNQTRLSTQSVSLSLSLSFSFFLMIMYMELFP